MKGKSAENKKVLNLFFFCSFMGNANNILDKGLKDKIKKLMRDIKGRVSYLRKDIDAVISSESQSSRQIEKILDELLDYSFQGLGEKEFRKLNGYYSHINKKASQDYNRYYREFAK